MKKTLTLNVEYLNAKKLKKVDELAAREALFKDSLASFKKQMKVLFESKAFKITKENWTENEIVIEFAEVIWEKLYAALCKADIVSIIDSIVHEDKG